MDYKKDFPIFQKHKNLVYLDSASTSQKPKQVINSIVQFYAEENANIHRGIYDLSEKSTEIYEKAKETIAKFINADKDEIIFTSGSTDSINKLSRVLPKLFKNKKEIVLTEMEHHSNIVPWQHTKMKLRYIPIKNNELNYEVAERIINEKTAILSITHISNSLGTINDIERIITLAKKYGAIVIIDASQSISHKSIDVKKLNCDFLVFSSHKLYGPTGIGVIYGKKQILEKLSPFNFGGDMIKEVSFEKTTFAESPRKFEAGTQNLAGIKGLSESIKYLTKLNIKNIEKHEKELTNYAIKELKKIPNIKLYLAEKEQNQGPIISFNLEKIHAHDVASILNESNIAIRAGHHCCMPLMNLLYVPGTCRISLAVYNTKSDIDKLIKGLKKVLEVFGK